MLLTGGMNKIRKPRGIEKNSNHVAQRIPSKYHRIRSRTLPFHIEKIALAFSSAKDVDSATTAERSLRSTNFTDDPAKLPLRS